MNYNFKVHVTELGTKYFYVNTEDKEYYILGNLTDAGWTPEKVQEIIDGVEANKTLAHDKDPYVWGNEDVTVFANEIGVLLIDKMALRAQQEVAPLELDHNVFLSFLEDFKQFISDNS